MSDMKCPFCNETELEKGIELQSGGFILRCPKCKKFARDVFWQELIRKRRALEIAVDGLEKMTWGCDSSDAEHLLKEIKTALEQKDE